MLVILRGISTEEDLLAEQRKELEVSLVLIRKLVGISKILGWGAFLYFRIVSCTYTFEGIVVQWCEGVVAQWYNPLTLQPEKSGGLRTVRWSGFKTR